MNLIANNAAILFATISSLAFYALPEIDGIRLTKLVVPEYVYWNRPAKLECQYDLHEDEKLYTVQWYKDNDEFYRFEKSGPRQVTYPIDEIQVDVSQSNEKKLVLRNANLMMRGSYKCEVSAEAPSRSFVTASQEARMEVVALPKEGPRIYGEQKTYQIGDTINLTCTSGKSFPAAKLKWFINNNEVMPVYEEVDEAGLSRISRSGIILTAGPEHFVNGHMLIRCQASISLGNHNVFTLPVHHNNTPIQPFSNIGYQKDALISVKGSGARNFSTCVLNLVSLLFYALLNDIT